MSSSPLPILRLKPEREAPLLNRHHAIYRTAIAGLVDAPNGSIVEVRSSENAFLGYAFWNPRAYICGRAFAFEEGDPKHLLKRSLARAVDLRRQICEAETDAVRVINAEGDAIPGLIVDRYGDILVVQFTTLGTEMLRPWFIEVLTELCSPGAIFEKSTGPARKKEGLEPREGWIFGKGPERITVTERGMKFSLDLASGQKTGLFLDQREERTLVKSLAAGRTILDCCSYVGGFSIAALSGGAVHADAVDYDAAALARAQENAAMNGVEGQFDVFSEDVFDFLRRRPLPRAYDFVILDPPAFAKRSSDLDPAKKAYTDLNRLGLQALVSGGLLLTCSCSYQMSAELFQTVVFHAARQANRSVKILQRHRQAFDHPVNLYHPESEYLKSMLLWVE